MSTRVEQNKYDHKQIDVEYNDAIITVDEGIVELLTMIWKEGYETFNSCQNNFGNIWIEFDMYSFHELVQKAWDYETDQMTSAHLYDFLQCECDNSVCLNDDGHPDEDDIFVWQGRVPEGRWRLQLTDPELGAEFEHAQDLVVFGDDHGHACVWEGAEHLESQYYHEAIRRDLFKEVYDDFSDEKMAKVGHELP